MGVHRGCNSTLKSDYFPIAKAYNFKADDPAKLRAERPYLIYPIGSIDEDPENLIEFYGASPRPVATAGHRRNRAMVTIEFFRLDDPNERVLYRDRALVIIALYPLLARTTQGAAVERADAQKTINDLLRPALRHLNAAKSFTRLFRADQNEAKAIYQATVTFMTTIS